jgi:DNA primase
MLFNNHNLSGGQVWITEGIWDAIRLWTFGEPSVSVFGSHIGSYQARALISKYSDAFLLFDGDDAGRKAKDEASELLRPYMNVYEVDLQYGDPADLSREEFRELIRQLNIKR